MFLILLLLTLSSICIKAGVRLCVSWDRRRCGESWMRVYCARREHSQIKSVRRSLALCVLCVFLLCTKDNGRGKNTSATLSLAQNLAGGWRAARKTRPRRLHRLRAASGHRSRKAPIIFVIARGPRVENDKNPLIKSGCERAGLGAHVKSIFGQEKEIENNTRDEIS